MTPFDQLAALDPTAPEAIVLQRGRNLSVRMPFGAADAVVKCFPKPTPFRRLLARITREPPRARRAYDAARFLDTHAPGSTPEPLAWCTMPDGSGRFASRYVEGLQSFTAALAKCYADHGPGTDLIALIDRVAHACRRMHDAGFFHGDLGNQNIMLTPEGGVLLIDLNRCRLFPEGGVPTALRARDLSRIALPSDFLRCFFEMYWQAPPPAAFLKAERRCRLRFRIHSRTRRYRHPFRPRRPSPEPVYPHPKDIWVWDPCSEQALVTLRPRDRRRYQSPSRVFLPLAVLLRHGWRISRALRATRKTAFNHPILHFANRAFISLSADPDRFQKELDYLPQLNCPGVHLRFYAHENAETLAYKLEAVHTLHRLHYAVAVSLVQCRESVRNPQSWRTFCETVLDAVHGEVIWVEYLHAVNRVKWGIWNFRELKKLLDFLPDLCRRYQDISFLPPAVIDFEWDYFAGAVNRIHGIKAPYPFPGASVELYVDRRGPPEAFQGKFDAVGKLGLLQAILHITPAIDNHLVVTEFNWPIAGTGVWSPVGAPYESPGPRFNDPSVSETQAAAYMLRYLLLGLCSGLASSMVFWSLAAHGFGLIDPGTSPIDSWRPRPGFETLAFFFRILRNGSFYEAVRRGTAAEHRVWVLRMLDKQGRRVTVAWQVTELLEQDAHRTSPHIPGHAPATPLPLSLQPANLGFTPAAVYDMRGKTVAPDTPISGCPLYYCEALPD